MRKEISLYISGRKVDLDEQSLILMNYTMDDLGNPTIVKNSYSKQITLQGTPNNNALFGDIWKADRTTLFGSSTIGSYFDPTRRTPFQIFSSSGEILEEGYVKLDNIKRDGGNVEYQISLYGGLGSFFYNLTYGENGEKKTLLDLWWTFRTGTLGQITSAPINRYYLRSAWQYISNPEGYNWSSGYGTYWDIINFAPAYNGFPEDFDANKACVDGSANMGGARQFINIRTSITEGDVTYGYHDNASSCLVTMENKHTEWEMRDLRSYLQRPVFSVYKFIDAITKTENNGGYEVYLDPEFFNENNPSYMNGWITLTMCTKQYRYGNQAIPAILRSSLSPCDYLVSIAKMFGLLFLYDNGAKKVSILTRNTFYEKYYDTELDLSERIDLSSPITISPMVMDTKWYQMGGNIKGEYAEQYESAYGRPYGVQKIDTGYEFDAQVKQLTKDIPLIEAADVLERSFMYSYSWFFEFTTLYPVFHLAKYETVEQELYNGTQSQKFNVSGYLAGNVLYFEEGWHDWFPKVQFHNSDNKGFDGANCYLLFNGTRVAPSPLSSYQVQYALSDDHPDMDTLNSGTPCWNLTQSYRVLVTELPSFRRIHSPSGQGNPQYVNASVEWGLPLERAVNDLEQDVTNPYTLYSSWWRRYMIDRYDVDTRVMKCKVNLQGLQVGQDLLRRFWWFDNSIWVLNKINNFSLTTDDLVECEFIKVKDKTNYYEGQTHW